MEYTIKFTEQELNIILAALGELPAKNTIDLIMKIKDEALLQNVAGSSSRRRR